MKFRGRLLMATIVSIPVCSMGQTPDSALLKLVRERGQIASVELEVTVNFDTYEALPNLRGGDWKIHYWFQSDRMVFRLDEEQSKSQEDGSRWVYRYAFDGKSYRVIDTDRPGYPVREFVTIKPQAVPFRFDPRILGIKAGTVLGLHNFSLSDVERIATNASSWKREDGPDGFIESYEDKRGFVFQYVFSKQGRLVRIAVDERKASKGPPLFLEMRMEYNDQKENSSQIPSKIVFKRYESDRLVSQETIKIRVIQLNKPIDPAICSWEALAPTLGARLYVDQKYDDPVELYWNGKAFEQGGPHASRKFERMRNRAYASNSPPPFVWLSILPVVALGGLLAYRLRRPARV